jgi:uncharacterized membrane protein
MVDVLTEIVIHRPREAVANYASNPGHAPRVVHQHQGGQLETAPPLTIGSRVAFRAHFLGRDLDYVYEFTELEPGARLVMETAQGPFPMQTTYTWTDAGDSSTRMALRNTGKPAGFSAVVNLVMAPMMRRAMQKDLAKLKQILEAA